MSLPPIHPVPYIRCPCGCGAYINSGDATGNGVLAPPASHATIKVLQERNQALEAQLANFSNANRSLAAQNHSLVAQNHPLAVQCAQHKAQHDSVTVKNRELERSNSGLKFKLQVARLRLQVACDHAGLASAGGRATDKSQAAPLELNRGLEAPGLKLFDELAGLEATLDSVNAENLELEITIRKLKQASASVIAENASLKAASRKHEGRSLDVAASNGHSTDVLTSEGTSSLKGGSAPAVVVNAAPLMPASSVPHNAPALTAPPTTMSAPVQPALFVPTITMAPDTNPAPAIPAPVMSAPATIPPAMSVPAKPVRVFSSRTKRNTAKYYRELEDLDARLAALERSASQSKRDADLIASSKNVKRRKTENEERDTETENEESDTETETIATASGQ